MDEEVRVLINSVSTLSLANQGKNKNKLLKTSRKRGSMDEPRKHRGISTTQCNFEAKHKSELLKTNREPGISG